MTRYPAEDAAAPTFVFGHGAGAGERHPWMCRVAAGLAARGVAVVTFDFPYMRDRRSRPDPPAVLEDEFARVWHEVATGLPADARLFAGGKSMGGRIASQVAANDTFAPRPKGLVFFGYPLHPPGAPSRRRDRHLPAVRAPLLFLHGTRDPFGAPEEMRDLAATLEGAELHLVDDGDHSLVATRRRDPAGQSVEHAVDVAARWMRARA
jgi:predicted alpha/beta-hydrolase family hydrolase